MNWLLQLFQRLKPAPKPTRYTVNWCTVRRCHGPVIEFGGYECETGMTFVTSHAQTYEAYSLEQALAMHRSDNPGTQPTSVIAWP